MYRCRRLHFSVSTEESTEEKQQDGGSEGSGNKGGGSNSDSKAHGDGEVLKIIVDGKGEWNMKEYILQLVSGYGTDFRVSYIWFAMNASIRA